MTKKKLLVILAKDDRDPFCVTILNPFCFVFEKGKKRREGKKKRVLYLI